MKIMITGAGGFLGSRLCEYFGTEADYEVIQTHRGQPNLSDKEELLHFMDKNKPEYLIHCAAISNLSSCEADPDGSYQVNVKDSLHLAEASVKCGTKMIFCSSDQVYLKNGIQTPHKESEELMPPHHYGKQKKEAEEWMMNHAKDTVCLRLSWMYDFEKKYQSEHDQLYTLLQNAMKNKEVLSFSVNDIRSITYVREIVTNIEKTFKLPGGIYNFGSENQFTTYDLVGRMLDIMNVEHNMINKDEKTFSDEPRNLGMSLEKIRKYDIKLQDTITGFQQGYMRYVNQ